MQQSVMRFADSAARGSALGTATGTAVPLAEGMVAYLDDLNAVQVFDGTGWTSPVRGIGANVSHYGFTTALTSSQATYQDWSGFNVTITPSSTSAKILVVAIISTVSVNTQDAYNQITATSGTSPFGETLTFASGVTEVYGRNSIAYLHSPATTSAVTYQVQYKGTTYRGNPGSTFSSITAIEVAA